MIRIAICDDIQYHIDELSIMLGKVLEKNTRLFSYVSPVTLLEDHQKNAFHIIFLDVEFFQDLNGIDVAATIRKSDPYVKIIFITGYPTFAQDVFETDPSYILLKPISEAKLRQAIDFVQKNMIESSQGLIVTSQGRTKYIPHFRIKYVESVKRMLNIYCSEESYHIYGKLDSLQAKLPDSFLRCHKSYLVNLNYVKHLEKEEFLLYSSESIPIAQRKGKQVRNYFYEFLEGKA